MDNTLEEMQLILRAAGCSDSEIKEAVRVYQAEGAGQLLRQLRKCRCARIEELHESQRRVDRLDYLIRQTQRTI